MSALQNLRGRMTRSALSLATIAILAFTAPSQAQFGLSGGIQDAFRPAFTTRDIQLAVDMLELDDAQKFILETLFEDYGSEFDMGVNAFRGRIAGLREELAPQTTPDPGQIMRVVFGTINEWREESRQLADQFTKDLQDLLNDDQVAMWPAFERKLFRLKYLKNGQLPGETLDLLNDVRDLELDAQAAAEMQSLLDEYELALDAALRKREDYMQRSQTELIDAIQMNDYALSVDVAEKQVDYRKGVRNVNEQYTATIAAALPEEASAVFVRRIRERTYPRIYRKTPAQRAFEAAIVIDGLDPDVAVAVAELQAAYLSELDLTNDRIRTLTRDYKPRELTNKVEQAAARLAKGEAAQLTDPTREAFGDRGKLGQRYMEQLRAVLSAEQFAALPGARRWLDPEERANAAQRRASPGKSMVIPDGQGTGTVPGVLKGTKGASDPDDPRKDAGGGN